MSAAKNRAINLFRRGKMLERKHAELGLEADEAQQEAVVALEASLDDEFGDDLLRLMFTACHPVLPTEGRIALKEFKKAKGGLGYIEGFQKSKDPPSFMVLLEDTAALLGIVIASLATLAVTQFHLRYMDGVASVLIGLILGTIAIALAQESKSLLIGEQADPALRNAIVEIAKRVSSVEDVQVVLAVQLGPDQVVVALGVRFPDDLPAAQIAKQIHEIEHHVRQRHPEVIAIYVRPRDDA
jgi:hypothetical protein